MPNVTIFMPTEKMPPDANLAALTDLCMHLCTEVLEAAPENVHIIYVGVGHGRGNPAYAEIKYRLVPFRTQAVMEVFMERLEGIIKANTGLAARIRCFGYAAPAIHARN